MKIYITTDLEDVDIGARTYLDPKGLNLQDNPGSDGDFTVSAILVGGSDREIHLNDRQFKRGGRITANRIEDTQPAIKDNIIVWKGGEGYNSEIYLYEIQPLFANAGYDFKMDFASVDSTVIRGKAGGGANQYRWLLKLTAGWLELTEWLPAVDGQTPLSLADKSGFVYGPQTLTLKVTDGATYASDQVTMDLIPPSLALVSPADGSEFNSKEIPVFDWEGGEDYRFKIQFSTVASFEGTYTLTFPESTESVDAWLNVTSITLEKLQKRELKGLLEDHDNPNFLYWRVLAVDRSGNVEISETRHLVVTK